MRAAVRSRVVRRFAAAQLLLEVQFWFPVWLIFLLDRGFTLAQALIADGIFRLVSVVSEFPVGLVADRIGRKPTYLALAAGSVLTFAAITQIGSVGSLVAVWVLWGVLWALASGAASAYLYELCERPDALVPAVKAFGLVRAVGSVAVLLSLLSAGYLYDVDPRLPFALTAALAVVAMVVIATLPSVPASSAATTWASLRDGVRTLTGDPRIRLALWLGILLLFYGWSVRILFQPLALDLRLGNALTGWMYAAFAAAGVVGGLASAAVRRRARRPALAIAFLALWVTTAVCAALPAWAPFCWLPVMGAAYTFGTTVLEVETNEAVPGAVRATAFGVVSCLAGIGIAVARPGLGLVTGNHPVGVAFGVWAVAGVVVIPAALLATRRLATAATVDAT